MSKLDLMNEYVANLGVMNVKLHNLHWNVVGLNFEQVHLFTQGLYEDYFLKFDDVAERVKILGETPLGSMKEFLAKASIEEAESKKLHEKSVLEIVKKDVATLKSQAVAIREAADAEDDFATVAMMEDHISSLGKNLWFVDSMIQ